MPASHAVQPAAARPRRFVSVGLVAALHVLVIYALLVGIRVVPNPLPPGPIDFIVIPQAPPTHHPLPPPPDGPPLAHPRLPVPTPVPTAPKFDYYPEPAQGPTTDKGPEIGSGNPPLGPTAGPIAIGETHTIPPYPMIAIRLGHEGTVRLAISLDQGGNVVSAQVERSSGYQELDAAAVTWVRSHWLYQPAMRDGQHVPATVPAMVTFRLDQIRG
jgi:protein TonB